VPNDPQTLFDEGKCYTCFGATEEDLLELALLSRILIIGFGPPTPGNIDISDASLTNDIIVTWTNGGGADTNEIWKSINGVAFAPVATVAGGVNNWHDVGGIPNGTQWYYKVRACNSNGCSAFTAVRSAGNTLGNLVDVNFIFPSLVIHFGTFDISLSAIADIVSWPLCRICGPITAAGSNVSSISFPSLKVCGGLDFGACNALAGTAAFPALIQNTGNMDFRDTNITLLSANALPALSGFINFDNTAFLQTASLASVVTIGDLLTGTTCPALTTANFQSLQTLPNGIFFSNCPQLTTLNLTALQNPGIDFIVTGTALTSIVLTNYTTCPVDTIFGSNAALTTIDFPNLTVLAQSFGASGCANLTNVSIPQVIFGDGFNIDLSASGLAAGSSALGTGVNGILARAVASGLTTENIDLSGGTNAPPSGQGIADKATLIGNGCTVLTN
jgi:hypothetical protein